MGHAQGMSMLYLEARCISVVRAAGSQGVQNGSISCVALVLVGARRDARDPGRERDRRLARPRGRVGQRRDRVALGDPQDGEADGAVPARHRLRHLRLLGDAAARQHLRRRQLRRRRPRRVAHDPARLAGRRRHRARRRGRGDARSGGGRRARCRPSSPSSGCPPVTDAEVEAATTGYDASDMPDRDRAADVEAADAALERQRLGARRRSRARPPRLRRRRARDRRHAAPAGLGRLSADLGGDRRGRARPLGRQRPERLPRPRHRLPARGRPLGARCRRSRTSSTRRRLGTGRRRCGRVVVAVGRGGARAPIRRRS